LGAKFGQDDKDDVRVKGDDGTDNGKLIGVDGTDRLKTDATIADGVDPTRKAQVDLLKQLKTTTEIRGSTDGTVIGNIGDSLKVSGVLVFGGDTVLIEPGGDYLGYVALEHCTQKAILEQLRIMNRHLRVLTDIEDMETETNNEPD
jgi:hypothetical protein